jgi:hypothetical protein
MYTVVAAPPDFALRIETVCSPGCRAGGWLSCALVGMPRADEAPPSIMRTSMVSAVQSVSNVSELMGTQSWSSNPAGLIERLTQRPTTEQDRSCGAIDFAAVVACILGGCGMVLGLAYLMYPGGFVCQAVPEGSNASGGRAALITLVGSAPIWGRNTVFLVLAYLRRGQGADKTTGEIRSESKAAGWLTIVGGSSKWSDARRARGLSQCQAVSTALGMLLLWHWSQSAAYFAVLEFYKCYRGFMDYESVGVQGVLALIVAAREAVYVASTLLAVLTCPAFLLLDPVTAWTEADTVAQKVARLLTLVLAPHNYVLLCLANKFRNWRRVFVALVGIQVVADFASCFALGSLWLSKIHNGDVPLSLMIGFTITALSFLLFFGPMALLASVAQACDSARSTWQRVGFGVLALSKLLGLVYLCAGGVLLCMKVDIVCIGYTFSDLPDCHGRSHGQHVGLTVRINNNSSKTLFLIGDQKTTIRSYLPTSLGMCMCMNVHAILHRF